VSRARFLAGIARADREHGLGLRLGLVVCSFFRQAPSTTAARRRVPDELGCTCANRLSVATIRPLIEICGDSARCGCSTRTPITLKSQKLPPGYPEPTEDGGECYDAGMRAANETLPPPIPPAEHIRKLVEANRVDDARRYAEELLAQGDTSVEGWAKVLRPPRIAASPYRARSDFAADYAWLRENREAYLDRWVALQDGTLLDADIALRALVERLTERGQIEGAFVVQVD
jgi:hypothetical protein